MDDKDEGTSNCAIGISSLSCIKLTLLWKPFRQPFFTFMFVSWCDTFIDSFIDASAPNWEIFLFKLTAHHVCLRQRTLVLSLRIAYIRKENDILDRQVCLIDGLPLNIAQLCFLRFSLQTIYNPGIITNFEHFSKLWWNMTSKFFKALPASVLPIIYG